MEPLTLGVPLELTRSSMVVSNERKGKQISPTLLLERHPICSRQILRGKIPLKYDILVLKIQHTIRRKYAKRVWVALDNFSQELCFMFRLQV